MAQYYRSTVTADPDRPVLGTKKGLGNAGDLTLVLLHADLSPFIFTAQYHLNYGPNYQLCFQTSNDQRVSNGYCG